MAAKPTKSAPSSARSRPARPPASASRAASKPSTGTGRPPRAKKSVPAPPAPPAPQPSGNKQAILIGLLKSATGATIAQMTAATGWQPHTVRGTISGVLRKKKGFNVTVEKQRGGGVYRIVEAAAE